MHRRPCVSSAPKAPEEAATSENGRIAEAGWARRASPNPGYSPVISGWRAKPATAVAVALATCVAVASCGAGGSGDAATVRPQVRLAAMHEGDTLAAGRATALVRTAHLGVVHVAIRLHSPGLAPISLGPSRRVKLAPHRWRRVQVLLSKTGLLALGRCTHGRVVATVAVGHSGEAARASRPLRLDPPGCARFFSRRSFWNTPLGRDAPLDPDSGAVTNELLRRVQPGVGHGPPIINTSAYTPPVYTVGAGQRRIHVWLDRAPQDAHGLDVAFRSVPLPDDARPASGGDRELVLWQPATDTLWEFWQLHRAADGWHASWGGRLSNVSKRGGVYPDPRLSWGTAATGLPLAGGLILPWELAQRRIDHVVAMGVPADRSGVFALPAQRADGGSSCRHAPVEGSRFRLDPALDIGSLHLAPAVATIARAAQRYGIVVRDQSGAVAFYAQNSSTFGRDPYPALFGGQSSTALLRSFPWSRLQLLRMDLVKYKSGTPGIPDLGGLLGRCG